jgi:AmmeMemoRadiSam system protein B
MRPPAVAGSWYPAAEAPLRATVISYLAKVEDTPTGDIVAIITPHAGLRYSGAVAAHAYRAVTGRAYDVAVLVGPSHHVGFDGVAIYPRGAFDTPLGPVPVAAGVADRLMSAPCIRTHPTAHVREHAIEMQLPFLRHVLPDTPIVPLVIGYQERETILALAEVLAGALAGLTPLIVASTDLSHYFDAERAASFDGVVIDHVARFDPDGLLAEFERYPTHERGRCVACGGGAAVAVMKAAATLGACEARTLCYADSGDVSGDKTAVVGYLAAALGRFDRTPEEILRPRLGQPGEPVGLRPPRLP